MSNASPPLAGSRAAKHRDAGYRRNAAITDQRPARPAVGGPASLLALVGALLFASCGRPEDTGLFEPGGGAQGPGGSAGAGSGSGGSVAAGAGGMTASPQRDSGAGASDAGDSSAPLDASASGVDSGRATPRDASPPDARSDALLDGAALNVAASCAGARALGVCWYLGELAQSCVSTCADHGGPDAAAIPIIGSESQGGSLDGCRTVLVSLGLDAGETVANGSRTGIEGAGVGCHLFGVAQDAWWLNSPDFAPSESLSDSRIACGCAF